MNMYVAVTQNNWFRYVSTCGLNGEFNFWRPTSRLFRCLQPGEPFLFKLHSPDDRIVGVSKFVRYEVHSINEIWTKYRERSGYRNEFELMSALNSLREKWPGDKQVGCIIVDDFIAFTDEHALNAYDFGWKRSIVAGKTYHDDEQGLLSRVSRIVPARYL